MRDAADTKVGYGRCGVVLESVRLCFSVPAIAFEEFASEVMPAKSGMS